MVDNNDSDDAHKFTSKQRANAHKSIDLWLDECERAADSCWSLGLQGYIGQFKLRAFTGDDWFDLLIDRTYSEEL